MSKEGCPNYHCTLNPKVGENSCGILNTLRHQAEHGAKSISRPGVWTESAWDTTYYNYLREAEVHGCLCVALIKTAEEELRTLATSRKP